MSKGPLCVAQVIEELGARDAHGRDFGFAAQHVDVPKPFSRKAFHAAPELVTLAAQHVWPELAVRPGGVALAADLLGKVEHDRDRQDVVLAGQRRRVAGEPRAGRSSRRRPSAGRASRRFPAMKFRTSNASPVALWSFSSSATRPGRRRCDSTSLRGEMCSGERGFAGARGADEHDQTQRRDVEQRCPRARGSRSHATSSAARAGSGEDRELARRSDVRIVRTDGQMAHADSRSGRATPAAHSVNSSRVHSKRWSR